MPETTRCWNILWTHYLLQPIIWFYWQKSLLNMHTDVCFTHFCWWRHTVLMFKLVCLQSLLLLRSIILDSLVMNCFCSVVSINASVCSPTDRRWNPIKHSWIYCVCLWDVIAVIYFTWSFFPFVLFHRFTSVSSYESWIHDNRSLWIRTVSSDVSNPKTWVDVCDWLIRLFDTDATVLKTKYNFFTWLRRKHPPHLQMSEGHAVNFIFLGERTLQPFLQ